MLQSVIQSEVGDADLAYFQCVEESTER